MLTLNCQTKYKCSWRSLLLLVPLALLSGCFDLGQNLVIDDTGRAELSMSMALNTTLASAVALERGVGSASLCQSEKPQPQDSFESDEIRYEASSRYEGTDLVCEWVISAPLERLAAIDYPLGLFTSLSVRLFDDRTAEIILAADFSADNQQMEAVDPELMALTQGLLNSFIGGRQISWSISAVEILTSNGQISADRSSVIKSVPMSMALSERGRYIFESKIVYMQPWYLRLF